ncbi:unnamed protein product [Arabidopsis lyrata]|nr:unnamed protein product [Arabidopsis lyrata]
MDVLSKKLDAGVLNHVYNPHPLCLAPLITHLSFADDVLIFFDGDESSLEGILIILEDFRVGSGLGLNKDKTALFLDGGNFLRLQDISNRAGLQCGSFPVRYLGLPLTSRKLLRQDYQPLLDKIAKRFSSWSVKKLSFAGRLQLIRGAKISWELVCTPKESGGLGLRRLVAWNKVLCLKLIWLIFAAAGSLWVSWVRRHLIGSSSFWDLDARFAGSWIWRNLCKLRPLVRPFIFCEVGSGITCSFWKDNWTSLGPLLDITGETGPRVTGLPVHAVVSDAIRDGDWWLSSSSSRNPIIQLLKQCLPLPSIVDSSVEDDLFLWKIGDHPPSSRFSTALTWHFLNPPGPAVDWHEFVWFKGRILKHAFITWVAARKRLHTRDKLLRWGLLVPPHCLLCNSSDETLQHLFFDCSFSQQVWSFFSSKAHVSPPRLFEHGLRWMKDPCQNSNIALILKLAYQASLYLIWKERNRRLHTQIARPSSAIILDVQNTIRRRLDPLSRAQRIIPPNVSFLFTWFQVFQS